MAIDDTLKITTNATEVSCTPAECLLTPDGGKTAESIKEGDTLISKYAMQRVKSVEPDKKQTVYHIHVPYFFANGICVVGYGEVEQ